MAIPSHPRFHPPSSIAPSSRYGILLRIAPTDVRARVEVERAPDSAGSSGTYAQIALVGPFGKNGGYFFDPLPNDGNTYWYRVRHAGPPYYANAGSYTTTLENVAEVRGSPRQFFETELEAAFRHSATITPETRGPAEFAVGGGSLKFSPTRHNEEHLAIQGDSIDFAADYETPPEVRVLPQVFQLPGTSSTSDRKIECKATGVSVSGITDIIAQMSTGGSATAESDDFAATQGGAPSASGIGLITDGTAAFCRLTEANDVETTYVVHYDYDTTEMDPGRTLFVAVAYHDGSTWQTVKSNKHFAGGSGSATAQFSAELPDDTDVRILISYIGTGEIGAINTVTADRVDYDVVTAGTSETLTPGDIGDALLIQCLERS